MLDYEYLIHLIYCAVHDEQPLEKPEEVSFYNVLHLGKIHEVANIAYLSVERLEKKPPQEIYDEWKGFYYLSAQRDTRQWLTREKIVNTLHENGIRTLEAQGTVTKRLYPSSELRMMSDIDIIIDFENLEKAMTLMKSLGYEISQKQPVEFDARIEDSELIEFHTDFFTEYMYNRKERYSGAVSSPFEYASAAEDDFLSFELSDTYYYLFTVLHTIAHFETMGCGIRRVLDLYYLKKALNGKVDKDVIKGVIDGNDLRKSYDALFALEEYWFENKTPSFDLSETVHDVILSGNHGTDAIFTRNNLRKDELSGVKFPKLKRIVKFVFPDKEYVYLGYPVCRERGYSTVRCWLYRIFATLKKFRFSHTVEYIKTVIRSK